MTEKYEADRKVIEAYGKKKRHVFWWIFLAIQVVYLVWIIAGTKNSQSTPVDCSHYTPQQCQSLRDARDAGTTIGVAFVVFLWAATDIIVGGTYAIYRLIKRSGK